MGKKINGIFVGVILVLFASQAYALSYKAEIKSEKATFINEGEIKAQQTVLKGVAHQKVGQRVRSQADVFLKFESRNDTFINKGKIIGDQKVIGGAGDQAVGQEVY